MRNRRQILSNTVISFDFSEYFIVLAETEIWDFHGDCILTSYVLGKIKPIDRHSFPSQNFKKTIAG